MEQKEFNNYPDQCVSKAQLKVLYFPALSIWMIERRIKEAEEIRKFKGMSIGTGGKLIINIRAFYLFLRYKEKNKCKWYNSGYWLKYICLVRRYNVF